MRRKKRKKNIIFLLASRFFLFEIGYVFVWKILAPLRKISKQSEEISLQNISNRLPIQGKKDDEIRVLSENLNKMFSRIEYSAKNLKQFTQDASHELRTPLCVIGTSLQLAIKTKNFNKVSQAHSELKKYQNL